MNNLVKNNLATCQVCFRSIKLYSGAVADHGFRKVGYRAGTCFGSAKDSFENSKKITQRYLTNLRKDYLELSKTDLVNSNISRKEKMIINNNKYNIRQEKKLIIRKLKNYLNKK